MKSAAPLWTAFFGTRKRFEDYFVNQVKQLTFTFPEDATTSSGTSFWSAPKGFAVALEYTSSDPAYLSLMGAASILRAETYGIPILEWALNAKKFAEEVDKVKLPKFIPKQGVKIVTDEKAVNTAALDDESLIDQLICKLEGFVKSLPPGYQMNPIQFEKDNDTNYRVDFISGLANVRARNCSIPEVDKLKAEFISGRIIPAIATATAIATGLVCLELCKVIANHSIEKYRNTFANLALPLFSMAEPVPPKTFKHGDLTWSIWDRCVIAGDLTLGELMGWLQAKALTSYSISCGQSLLYHNIFPRHKDRMDRKVLDLAKEIAKLDIPPNRRHFDLVVACENDEGDDLDVPLISICFR